MKFPRGHAIWVYEPDDNLVEAITRYNEAAAVKIEYIFVYDGSVYTDIRFVEESLAYYAERLPTLKLYANLDGPSSALSQMTNTEKYALSRKICDRYGRDSRVSGLHLDIEPFSDESVSFYSLLKDGIDKPLSIALYDWNPEVLRICDLPVLMAYDSGSTPEKYANAIKPLTGSFAADASQFDCHFIIGLPFVATHEEYEYRISRATGEREDTGFTMDQYLEKGIEVVGEFTANPLFTGIAVWGGLNSAVGGEGEKFRWYPYTISERNWQLLKRVDYTASSTISG